MVGVQVTDEQLESITDRTVQEADEDGDGAVSFLEFTKVRSLLGQGSCGMVPRIFGHGQEVGKKRAKGEFLGISGAMEMGKGVVGLQGRCPGTPVPPISP